MRKISIEEFIKKAREVHGDKYDYPKVEYNSIVEKVCIICPIHGEFWQRANVHLMGSGCPKCSYETASLKLRQNQDSFIKRAREVHGDKYDYSKVEYVNSHTKVCIICPEHGEFWQTPYNHLNGQKCPKCAKENTKSKLSLGAEEFIRKAREMHGNKYDYSKVDYKNARTKVCIICPIHGEFWQIPFEHLKGRGCQECSKLEKSLKNRKTLEQFIIDATRVHGNKYDYSKVEYINDSTKVCIICPEHGEFWQTPNTHLRGSGCRECGISKRTKLLTKSLENFIEEAKEIHGDRYDYSKVEYNGRESKVCIICLEHGEFWQTPHSHLSGNGCQLCNESKLEKEIKMLLDDANILVEQQFRANWLGKLSFDFYLPDYNIAIECQGIQHFEEIKHFGGQQRFKNRVELDNLKYKLCEEHGIKLLYYSNLGINYPYKVFEDKKELLNEITK